MANEATQVQWRRGTDVECAGFTGAIGEIVVDTTNNKLYVHDGVTQGGHLVSGGGEGLSAYELAVQNGFVGTLQEWLNSLQGTPGLEGGDGLDGSIITVNELLPNSTEGTIVYYNGQLYIYHEGEWILLSEYVIGESGITGDVSGIPIVSSLPTEDNYEGRIVMLSTDNKLYIYTNDEWVLLIEVVGPVENAITTVDSLPSTGTEGQLVIFEDEIYIYKDSTWVLLKNQLTPDAPEGIEIVDVLPTSGNINNRVVFLTTEDTTFSPPTTYAANKLYKYVDSNWIAVVEATGVAEEVADGSITTAKFAAGIVPVEIVSTLPTTSNFEGRVVFLTTDNKMYRHTGSSFVSTTAATDITGELTTTQIANNSITTGKINTSAITADKLDANSVIAGKIAAGAISATEIASNAITTTKLAAGQITTEKIASLAITAEKIATGTITANQIAANTITGGKIQAAAIGTSQLAADSITAEKVQGNAITAGKIQAGSISTDKMSANSINGDRIATNTLTGDKIYSNSITAGKIQAGAIGTTLLAANAVTADKLDTNELITGTAQIADGIISTLKIGDDAVMVPLSVNGEEECSLSFSVTSAMVNSNLQVNFTSFAEIVMGTNSVNNVSINDYCLDAESGPTLPTTNLYKGRRFITTNSTILRYFYDGSGWRLDYNNDEYELANDYSSNTSIITTISSFPPADPEVGRIYKLGSRLYRCFYEEFDGFFYSKYTDIVNGIYKIPYLLRSERPHESTIGTTIGTRAAYIGNYTVRQYKYTQDPDQDVRTSLVLILNKR